jgi:hypothetical protein
VLIQFFVAGGVGGSGNGGFTAGYAEERREEHDGEAVNTLPSFFAIPL